MPYIYDLSGEIIGDLEFYTPEMYGAVGDGRTDDTVSIQSAINNGGIILFNSGKEYKITDVIRIPKDTILELNGSVLNFVTPGGQRIFVNFLTTDVDFTEYNGNGNIAIKNGTIIGGNISFGHGENILIDNVVFKNGLTPHFLEICACKNYYIRNCSFIGVINSSLSVHEYINVDPATYNAFPLLPRNSAFFDGTKNDGIIVENCYFGLGTDDYNYGYNAFGVHGVAGSGINKNIRLVGNTLRGFTGCGFRINDMENVFIANNDISVEGDGIRVGDVGQSTNVLIKGNIIKSSGTAVTKANNSTVFQSADNDINPTFS